MIKILVTWLRNGKSNKLNPPPPRLLKAERRVLPSPVLDLHCWIEVGAAIYKEILFTFKTRLMPVAP